MKVHLIRLAHTLGEHLATLPLNFATTDTQVFEFCKWYIQKTYLGDGMFEILARYKTEDGYARFFAYKKPYNYGSQNVVHHDDWVIEIDYISY